jgi:hypothetical protein
VWLVASLDDLSFVFEARKTDLHEGIREVFVLGQRQLRRADNWIGDVVPSLANTG